MDVFLAMKAFFLLFWVAVVSGVVFEGRSSSDEGSYDGGRGGHHHHHHHHSSSGSGESGEGGGGGGGGRPSRPPPVTVNTCPDQWMTFDRPLGRWCVAVFVGNFNNAGAQAQCAAKGATLTGIYNGDERMRVATEARRLLQINNMGASDVWLGATRKARCPRVLNCAPGDTFDWTDGHTNGTDGWFFSSGQPDGLVRNGVAQSCVHQFVFPYSETSSIWPNIFHGNFDDQHCGEIAFLYACGKSA